MHYKKEHFILLLKDLVKYLSLVYCKGDFFEINLLNTNNLSLNVERPYIINNQHLAVSFHQKKTRTHFKIIVHFERDKKLIMYFDKEFQDIQIFLNKNNDKINIKKTADIDGVLNQKTLSIEEGAILKIKTETYK